MRSRILGTMLGVIILAATTSAHARKITIDIPRTDVQAYTPAATELGNYYVFNLAIPEKLPAETFMDASLELYVDAASDIDDAATGGIVTFEIFPLKSSLSGELDATRLRSTSMKKIVRTGESRRVRIPIGEHVRYLLDHPGENFGLAMGSLSGQRLGKFTVRHDVLGTGIVGRVTIVYDDLSPPTAAAR